MSPQSAYKEHHVIFIFVFSSAGSFVKRPAMITDTLHPSTGFKIQEQVPPKSEAKWSAFATEVVGFYVMSHVALSES